MAEAENKAIVRRFFEEVWNEQKDDVIDEIFASNVVLNGQPIARDALKKALAGRSTAFSDIHILSTAVQVQEGWRCGDAHTR
jgi:hypothetical protein